MGQVNEHWDKLLMGAALSGAFAASSAALAGTGGGLAGVDPGREAILGAARPVQETGEGYSKRFAQARPTLTVPQGSRVAMLLTKDLYVGFP